MNSDRAVFLVNEMLGVSILVSAPLLIGTLIVGLLISVFQVATQIQEITLTYVPKLAVSALILLVLGSWMLGLITQFARSAYSTIPTLGQ
ncbi:flagellar biosynthetic protein FliQ [Candidatus Phycosocius spiralis]|nr:flagellar biosynthetic protein FliQ [Candidatus Phycosocius spiralis]